MIQITRPGCLPQIVYSPAIFLKKIVTPGFNTMEALKCAIKKTPTKGGLPPAAVEAA
jgi:hypothetical protein